MDWVMLMLVFLVTVVAVSILARQADDLKLLAHPGEHRQHQSATPMVGGIGMYLGILFGFVFIDNTFYWLMPSLFLLCVVGALDDRYKLPSWLRFIAQGIAAYLMIRLTGVELLTLGYLFSHQELLLGSWATPITIFACIGMINAINMSDGLDGLAASLVLLCVLSVVLLGNPDPSLALITIAVLLGFLFWNIRIGRSRASVFMGDAGSTMLGLLLAYLLINFSQAEQGIWPVTALWLIALPLMDAVGVLLVRPLRGASPFTADRIHYHHQLMDQGLSVNASLACALIAQATLSGVGVFLWKMNVADHLQFYGFLFIFAIYLLFLFLKTASHPSEGPEL